MKQRLLLIFGIGVSLALLFWITSRPATVPPKPAENATAAVPVATNPVISATSPPGIPASDSPAPQKPRTEESRASSRRDLANPLTPSSFQEPSRASASDPATEIDLDKITLMFRDYRTITGENPVGTNAEIMKSIMGGNPKGAMLGPPEGQTLNEHGELIDRWGTPYFFHQLTKDLMEIHSAGPDRKMWSDDDILSN